MIEVDGFEEVTRIRMSIEADGRAVYWVAAYLVDGLLIDTGCPHTAEELAGFLAGQELRAVVNTHFHEDHVGADRLIRERFGVDIFAHPDSVPPHQPGAGTPPLPGIRMGVSGDLRGPAPGHKWSRRRASASRCSRPGGTAPATSAWWRWGGARCFSGDIFISERPRVIRADEDAAGLSRP